MQSLITSDDYEFPILKATSNQILITKRLYWFILTKLYMLIAFTFFLKDVRQILSVSFWVKYNTYSPIWTKQSVDQEQFQTGTLIILEKAL